MGDFNSISTEIFQALSAFAIVYGVLGVIGIVLFILNGLGLYKMAKNIEISNKWLAFIPIANNYVLGSISQKYIKADGSKSAKFGIILPLLSLAKFILTIALFIFSVISVTSIISNVELAIENDSQMTMEMFKSFIPVIILYFVLLAIAIWYAVSYFIALWRVYSLYDSSNATVFLIVSILFGAITPIFLFILSNNRPVFLNKEIDLFETEVVEESL